MKKDKITKREMILYCVWKRYGDPKLINWNQSFSKFDVVVACYEEFRDEFGLDGYKDKYPDSNPIYSAIMGNKGTPGLKALNDNKYCFEPSMAEVLIRKILSKYENYMEVESSIVNDVPQSLRRILERLKNSEAYKKYLNKEIVTVDEAYRFWNLSAFSNSIELKRSHSMLEELFNFFNTSSNEENEIKLDGNVYTNLKEIKRFKEVHEKLLNDKKIKFQLDAMKQIKRKIVRKSR